MIGASARPVADSALHFEHLTEDQSTILQSRSGAMPYQLREARKEVSALVCATRNSLKLLLNLFGFAGLVVVRPLLHFYHVCPFLHLQDSEITGHDPAVHSGYLLSERVRACPCCLRIFSAIDGFRIVYDCAQSALISGGEDKPP
jgi:hypothetical protein